MSLSHEKVNLIRIPPRIIEPASTILPPFSQTEMYAETRRQHISFLLAFPKELTFVTRWGTITRGGTKGIGWRAHKAVSEKKRFGVSQVDTGSCSFTV